MGRQVPHIEEHQSVEGIVEFGVPVEAEDPRILVQVFLEQDRHDRLGRFDVGQDAVEPLHIAVRCLEQSVRVQPLLLEGKPLPWPDELAPMLIPVVAADKFHDEGA